ncbi:MAG: hypothetical protein AB7R00_22970 [Kofleriaceae bacterium]
MRAPLVVGLALICSAALASAQPGITPPYIPRAEMKQTSYEEWYGWKILIGDAAALSTLALIFSYPPEDDERLDLAFGAVLGVIGSISYFELGAPAIHLMNRNYLAAAGSFALRSTVPAIGYKLGDPDAINFNRGAVGFLVGTIAVSAVDATFLSTSTKVRTSFVMPQLGVSPQGGVRVGLSGEW